MTTKVSVEHLCLCEYVTQDFQGKFIVAGIHGGGIVFQSREESSWSKFKIFCDITPLSDSFFASIVLKNEDGANILKVDFSYTQNHTPEIFERSVFNLDIPPVSISIGSKYLLQFICDKKIIKERLYQTYLGSTPQVEPASVKILNIEPNSGPIVKQQKAPPA